MAYSKLGTDDRLQRSACHICTLDEQTIHDPHTDALRHR
jgi:hypothetical protein